MPDIWTNAPFLSFLGRECGKSALRKMEMIEMIEMIPSISWGGSQQPQETFDTTNNEEL